MKLALLAAAIFFLGMFVVLLGGQDFPSRVFLSQVVPGPNESVFFLEPQNSALNVSDIVFVQLKVSTSEAITSTKAYLDFDSTKLSLVDIENTNSDFGTWWEPNFGQLAAEILDMNANGKIRLQASTPFPGFNGNNGFIAKLAFQAIGEGTTSITYDPASLALKPDDSNILNLSNSTATSFTIVLSSPTPTPTPAGGGGGGGTTDPTPAPSSISGDCNNDGTVNIFDFSILLSNWGKPNPSCDFNNDGKADIFDFSILLSNWS